MRMAHLFPRPAPPLERTPRPAPGLHGAYAVVTDPTRRNQTTPYVRRCRADRAEGTSPFGEPSTSFAPRARSTAGLRTSAEASADRLLVRDQLLDGPGRHLGATGDLDGDSGGIALAAVESSMVEPGPHRQRPPFDAGRRVRPPMGQPRMKTGERYEQSDLPPAGRTQSRETRHRHGGSVRRPSCAPFTGSTSDTP